MLERFKCFHVLYLIGTVETYSLHSTTIRNEHAYYCCIAQLLESLFLGIIEPESTGQLKPAQAIYIFGDSHTLPLAWRKVSIRNAEYRFVPKLATGVKAFHLRPESKFYPKVNFQNVSDSIPHGSNVVFVFCEIDCREGILVAVEKDRYRDVDAGITHVVEIYMAALEELIAKKKFKAFIHPVSNLFR